MTRVKITKKQTKKKATPVEQQSNDNFKFASTSIKWAAVPLAIIAFVDSLSYGMVAPVFPAFRDAADLTNSTSSLLAGFFAVGVILGFPLRLLLLKLVRPKTLLVAAGVLGAVSYAAFQPQLAGDHLIWLFVLRAVQGFASSFFFNGIIMTILQLNKEKRLMRYGAVLGTVFSMYALGNVIAPLAGLMPNPTDFFYVIAAVTLLTVPVSLWLVPKTDKAIPYLDFQVLKQTHVKIGWLTGLVCGVSIGIIMVSVPLVLSATVSSSELGMLYALAAVPLVMLSPIVGNIVQKTEKTTRLIMLSSIGLLVLTVLTPISSALIYVLILLALVYSVMSLVETGGMTIMARDGVQDKGYILAASIYGVFYDIGWSFAPASVSWIDENTSIDFLTSAAIVCGVSILIVLVIWLSIRGKKSQEIDTLTSEINTVSLHTGAHPAVNIPGVSSKNQTYEEDNIYEEAFAKLEYMERKH